MPNEKKSGLGRGLAALIPTDASAGPRLGNSAADTIIGGKSSSRRKADVSRETDSVSAAVYREISPQVIQPNPKQPRTEFDEDALAELEHSVREFGLLQPIVVRDLGNENYQLIMGERRLRASQRAGLDKIPAIVRHTEDDDLLRDALLENIHRVQLNPLEEAAAYEQLLKEFGVTQSALAARIGRSRPVISNTIRLLGLPAAVQRRVAAGVLSAGHARALLSLEGGPEAVEELAKRIVAEGMSVRATEDAVALARITGNTSTPEKAVRKAREVPAELTERATSLSDAFDTRVSISMGKRKGKMVIEFASVEDLDRITEAMNISRQ